ncbi:MAG TPA: efflux RND transporter periplasmic adaptor subunit [Candidatus Acidoferrum sp.]|nr:efflux RND transporter periplasmic adaptor subunit [Candidatus Acidoferrum sp.]
MRLLEKEFGSSAMIPTNRKRVATLLGVLSLLACGSACTTNTAETAPNLAIPVTVAKAAQKTVPIELSAIGSAEAYSTVSIKSQVNAVLEQVHFEAGAFVKRGDLLFTLDARPFQAALDQAQATLAHDKAQADLNEVQAQRYEKLFEAGVAPKEQLDQMKTTAVAQEAAVQADEAAAKAAKLQLDYCQIFSPVDGRTGAVQVYPGNVVKQNDVPILVVINQVTPIYVDFAVPEQYLSVVKKYMAGGHLQVEATPYGDTTPEVGILTFVDNSVDNTTGTIKLKGTFQNPDHRLWPGQFSNVSLRLTEQEDAIVVPSQAVQTGQSGDFVYIVGPDMSAEARPVKVARTIGPDSVISQGVSAGDRVVTDGQLRLIPGIKVQIKGEASSR